MLSCIKSDELERARGAAAATNDGEAANRANAGDRLVVMPCVEHPEIDPYPLMTTQDLRDRPPGPRKLPDRYVRRKPEIPRLNSLSRTGISLNAVTCCVVVQNLDRNVWVPRSLMH
jgi:hypothetical protein